MIVVGLTGGIGSGKSTVSERLVALGAVLVDADAIVRELQAPGGAALTAMVERFGESILAADGTLDRAAVAGIVFGDEAALADLNRIVHPLVGAEIVSRLRAAGDDDVLVLDIPLLIEGMKDGKPRYPVSGILVVDTPVEVAVERLVVGRGFDPDDARRRIGAQVSREDRLAVADHVVDNGGSLEELAPRIEAAWSWISTLEPVDPAAVDAL